MLSAWLCLIDRAASFKIRSCLKIEILQSLFSHPDHSNMVKHTAQTVIFHTRFRDAKQHPAHSFGYDGPVLAGQESTTREKEGSALDHEEEKKKRNKT
mmetsp:Transcript_10461/g.20307  ORF Transcript_10461/g.20307 Transcript_10461/m.20307 type:complete len:98 (+) Transcript_10461:338-631(+)